MITIHGNIRQCVHLFICCHAAAKSTASCNLIRALLFIRTVARLWYIIQPQFRSFCATIENFVCHNVLCADRSVGPFHLSIIPWYSMWCIRILAPTHDITPHPFSYIIPEGMVPIIVSGISQDMILYSLYIALSSIRISIPKHVT